MMFLSMLLVVFGPGSAPHFRIPQAVDRPLFDVRANEWINPIRESSAERQMLWDAERVLYYSGRITGQSGGLFISNGVQLHRRLTVGWYSIEPVHSIPSSDQFRITQTFNGQTNRTTVIVVDRRDYQDAEGSEAVAEKVAELKRDGVEQVTVLLRGAESGFFQSPPFFEMMLLYWIGDAELTVLITHDFSAYPMINSNRLTLDLPTDRLREQFGTR